MAMTEHTSNKVAKVVLVSVGGLVAQLYTARGQQLPWHYRRRKWSTYQLQVPTFAASLQANCIRSQHLRASWCTQENRLFK